MLHIYKVLDVQLYAGLQADRKKAAILLKLYQLRATRFYELLDRVKTTRDIFVIVLDL